MEVVVLTVTHWVDPEKPRCRVAGSIPADFLKIKTIINKNMRNMNTTCTTTIKIKRFIRKAELVVG